MKILMVISHGFEDGGAESSVLLMRDQLTNRGHQVKILSANDQTHSLFSDYQFEPVATSAPLKALLHLFYMPAFRTLKSAIRDFQPHVIHFHTLTACSPSVLFATSQTPAIMTIHGPEEFTLQLLPWFFSPSDYRRTAFDLRHLTPVARMRYWYYRLLQRPIYRLGLRRLKTVIVPSRYMINATADEFRDIETKLVYNGVELPKPAPTTPKQTLLFVGRLEQMKGVDYLINAFAKALPNIPAGLNLRIVGHGSQRTKLEQLATSLGLAGRIEFTGWIKTDRIRAEYAATTALIVPSLCPEAFGLVAVEAMATGRPVIGTSVGALPEIIQDGQTGLIIPPADADALASAIIRLATDPELVAKMGEQAATATKRFDVQNFISHLESIYTTAASPRF